MVKRLLLFFPLLSAVIFSFVGFATGRPAKPNIVILVADDMGWADVGYHGSTIRTPNIDRLQKGGAELDMHYVAPMCTPTRVGLLTGRYWSRFGNTKPSNERVLPWDIITLPKALKEVGYQTAIAGKWHLGSKPEWGPTKFGFDQSYGSLAGGINPWNHLYKHGPYSQTWHRNDRLIQEKGHVTDLLTKDALRFIKESKGKPFFLYVPYTAVHTPFDEPDKWLERVKNVEPERRQYVACLEHMDDSIGQIIDAINKLGQKDNTLVIFFSDNGGTNGDDSSRYPNTKAKGKIKGLNTPLRGWKSQLYEGGIRVPAIAYWPGKIKPKKVKALTHVTDWMPTICGLVGYDEKPDLKWDGLNIWPLITNKIEVENKRILYCKGVNGTYAALHQWPWKLIAGKGREELFDLSKDPNEKNDISKKERKIVNSLKRLVNFEAAMDNDKLP